MPAPARKVTIAKEIDFAASHHLYPGSGVEHCERNHGHNWVVKAYLRTVKTQGSISKSYGDIKRDLMELVHARWDHSDLNEDHVNFGPLIPPTCENVASTIFEMLQERDARYIKVEVWENYPNNYCCVEV